MIGTYFASLGKQMVDWIARRIWFGMLWFMRRPRIKRFRRTWIQRVPEYRREAAWSSFRRQERWGRRHGLPILRGVIGVAFVVIFAELTATWVWFMQSTGGFTVAR